jgi:hypothetical protein
MPSLRIAFDCGTSASVRSVSGPESTSLLGSQATDPRVGQECTISTVAVNGILMLKNQVLQIELTFKEVRVLIQYENEHRQDF